MAVLLLMAAFMPRPASAFPADTYAGQSLLASGRWVKISVAESGIHLLTPTALRQMGFSDPTKVRVFGYGAMRLPESLSISTFVDDLPEVPVFRDSKGIYFYGHGPFNHSGNYPTYNPFTTLGYYFLTDSEMPEKEFNPVYTPGAVNPTTQFTCRVAHERELESPGGTGHVLTGESFLSTPKRTFEFTLPDRTDEKISLYTSFMAKAPVNSYVYYSVNGTQLPTIINDRMLSLTDSHGHYNEAAGYRSVDVPLDADKVSIEVSYPTKGADFASLNFLSISYSRALRLVGSSLLFNGSNPAMSLEGAGADTRVLDITKPADVRIVNTQLDGSTLTWTVPEHTSHTYIAFNIGQSFPAPKYAGTVENQDLHSMPTPDMVIFAPREFLSQANRLADRRRLGPDSLKVAVVNQDLVFNEFASGSPDVQAFRKMLKMLYDRGLAEGTPLRYALFMGRGTFDNRHITSEIKSLNYPMMPIWQSDGGSDDTSSYTTDDIFAFLLDGSGTYQASDTYCIGVGRLPVTSANDAKGAIDKIIEYEEKMAKSTWRNRAMIVADDEDRGIHMDQSEKVWNWMLSSDGGEDILYDKLYIDLYPRDGNTAVMANKRLIKSLEEGLSWLTYLGHANTTSLSHENLLTYNDINNLHLRQYPVIVAGTCDFLHWDAPQISAAEIMWKLSSGGAIAVVSANRPVYIPENGPLVEAFGRHIFERDSEGRRLTLGEINKRAKNDYCTTDRNDKPVRVANSNKLRYVLLGDPSMRTIVPRNHVAVDSINGIDLQAYPDQAVLKANQDVTVKGHISDGHGSPIAGFNGTLNVTLYDAEQSLTTLGTGGDTGKKVTYDTHGDRLFEGYFPVKDGVFDINIPMPSEIANNFRPATMSLYAYPSADDSDAAGCESRLYVFGRDETAAPDTIAPVIETFYLNHSSFESGETVNSTPVAIAKVSDNRAINMSSAGVGHQMILKLDGSRTFTDVPQFYTASADGSPSGTIAYQLPELTEGPHSLMLRVWDSQGNSAVETIDFVVKDGMAPTLYDVYTDANPASVEANFYLTHDRPEAMIEVTVTVFNLMGQPVWSTSRTGRSDLFSSFPINWNLCDNAGRRVNRGIYLYRASVTCDGMESGTKTHKIAVAAQ